MAYTPPIYSHNAFTGSSGTGATLDISACSDAFDPPCVNIIISATATVILEASHDLTNWIDYSSGGFTASNSYDLVLSQRYWRTRVTANSGSVTSVVGPVATRRGGYVSPNLLTVTTTPTGI